jgi:hypothetical protein
MTELLYGRRAASTVGANAPVLDLGRSDELEIKDMHVYYVLFETPMEAALARLPTSLHPAIPAHFGITFWRAKESAIGPFELAFVGLACRSGIKPRHFVHGAFASTKEAQTYFSAKYGFPCQRAEVRQRELYDRIEGSIALDGRTILEVITTNMQPVVGAGATVKYSPALCAAETSAGRKLVQLETSYQFARVMRGTPRATVFDAEALGDAAIKPAFPMSGAHAITTAMLHPPRFMVDPATPAESGGAQKLPR